MTQSKTFTLCFAFFILVFNNLNATDISWTGNGDGSNWSDGANWSSNSAPEISNEITIDCNCTVVLSAEFKSTGSIIVALGSTLDASSTKIKLDADNAYITNYGVLLANELKAEVHTGTIINNYGQITAEKFEDKHVPNASTFNNYSDATLTVTTKLHYHGTINNFGTIDGGNVSDKVEIHGATLTGGGETIADNIIIKSEGDDSNAYVENQSFTTSDGCAGGSSVTFNGSEFNDVKDAIAAIDGYSFHSNDVYVCGTNSIGVDLPIELTSFVVTQQENDVLIEWVTASEENNSHFIIERSSDGRNWKDIARVEGAGNSNVLLNYSFSDKVPLDGVSYYRLLQVDFDRNFEYFSAVAVIREVVATLALKAYPVPANNNVQVLSSENDFTGNTFKVFSASGHDVTDLVTSSSKANSEITLNISSLKQGVYIFKTRTQMVRFHKM
ncbi:T9SS type A sorting domain-containing protein [Flammeovirga kamogawensis]|uniref:T9SS type A sorting domain-containing protein n=1 Tax=Flammeovirga kamogawensis TaxID=373891 RepID=A0ABX8H1M9_9BACT|nr:T9SS type A sorting domain-containing protein [Flammeovirga kamogawensis]MBB6463753.1 hypothetical protein [Flammeovirga kamogawensis]QWG09735.1 T9SS type A sorting domain-containing protein [Flammeovirga kamogawensis]TRX65248.1 T9SS type A sorting domain-containing protein [Flammeovirga kamogawensis]